MDTYQRIITLLLGIIRIYGYDNLSKGKSSSILPLYQCPKCDPNRAVDDLRETCTRTDAVGKEAPKKSTSWTVDLGGIDSMYSVSIQFREYDTTLELRQKGRFAGFSLYISNTRNKEDGHLCYKNTIPLPPLEFNTTCIGYGRYVIYYNERLDGVTYPEGYQNPTYTQLCEVKVEGCAKTGVYGVNCSLLCPKNCYENKCNIVNGICLSCGQGWIGDKCTDKCPSGWYGTACQKQCVGYCRGNIACNHVTGYCEGGCADGWTGRLCNKPCEAGSYGPDCVHNCSGYCLDNKYCNKENGHCDNGCSPGYSGDLCDKLCSPGSFGKGCSEKCSETCKNKTCDHMNGTCIDGCVDGFTGINCSNKCNKGHFGTNCTGICPLECYYTCQHTDGSCIQSQRVKDSHSSEAESTSTNASTVGGILGACTFIIITVVLVVLFLRYKRRVLSKYSDMPMKTLSVELPTGKLSSKSSNKARDEHVQSVKRTANDEQEKAKKGPPTKKNIPVINLNAIIAKMSAGENSGFKHEYHEIPRGELCPCEEAKKPENKPKNRYTTTFAYDHSRVVLKKTQEGNYINANYIENALNKRTCTSQPKVCSFRSPKPKTIADFWQMVWQEEVTVIVCLTNLKEGGKNKCAQYWPDVNDKLQTGDLTLRNLEEKTYSNYTQRRFKAYNVLEQKDREVVMFHYTRWLDHGVPDPLNLVVFHRHVMKTSPKTGKYTLVHCSAGIGRTGTFIALDALYREGERNGKVNVPMYVRTMRKDRMNMIQGDDQYKRVYLALCKYFNGKSRCLTPSMFTKEFQDKTYTNCGQVTKNSSLASEFQELLSLRKDYTDKDYESGRTNVSANYTESVLPVEEFLCYLSYTKGRNTYYNAVLLQSFTENDSLISAQYPLPDYTEDFLRLIRDFDARVVVFMCPLKDLKSTSIWLPTKSEHKTVGNFTTKLTSSVNSTNFASRNIILKAEEGRTIEITVLECKAWKEGKLTIDKRALLDLIKETKTEKFKHKEGRVVILSSDGATRCGAFCVVYNALEQLSMDQEVDIFTITRQLQIRRPEFVSNLDEYQLSYDAVSEYIQNDSVYANC